MKRNISNTIKSIITSSKDNESMCKQALWLTPAPARTPNHHNHNAMNYHMQNTKRIKMHLNQPKYIEYIIRCVAIQVSEINGNGAFT